ncbi:hypothetical protein F5887DRAFT_1110780 [Amanita rubescens]|nr:hypothetical protein F5887DRAFT_1110780 [Amanita rubescens]
MNCLARRVLRLGSLPPPRQGLWLKTSQQRIRTYAKKVDKPKLPHPETSTSFERLFFLLSLLNPGQKQLAESEMALLIAGLLSSTDDKDNLTKIAETISPIIESYDRKELYAKVNEARKKMNDTKQRKKAENVICNRLGVGKSKEDGEVSYSPPPKEELYGKPLFEQLFRQLESPYAISKLRHMDHADLEEFSNLMKQGMDSRGRENAGILNTIQSFLAERGLEVVYYRDENPEPVDIEFEEYELAQMAVEDESLNPLETPAPEEENDPYPNLMTPDPLLDPRDELVFPPTDSSPYTNRVIVRNHTSIFHDSLAAQSTSSEESDWLPEMTDDNSEDLESFENLPLSSQEINELYKFPLIARRVTQQTGKGKIHRVQYLVVVGNGDGLVGYGQATDEDSPRALAKATAKAIRSMDTVTRFEKRTIPTDMETKFGSTRIIMRPRPVGFGLRCNPNLHQVLKAAGIKDISAKVWGSRNPVAVVKAAFRMLWAGHAPVSMGDGVGGKGRKLDKGEGVRSVWDVERERGRKMVGLRL